VSPAGGKARPAGGEARPAGGELGTALSYWPSSEALERRAALRDLLRRRHDPATVRPAVLGDEPYDPDLWRRLTADMGVAAILAPEALDGLGLGYEDFALAVGELGRVLYTGPFFGSAVLALGALLPLVAGGAAAGGAGGAPGSGHDRGDFSAPPTENSPRSSGAAAGDARLAGDAASAAVDLARRVLGGDTVAALAFANAGGRWAPGEATVTARETSDGWQLAGRRHLVVNAPQAEVFCVPATIGRDGGPGSPDLGSGSGADGDSGSGPDPGLFAVRAGDVEVTAVDSIDPTRSLGTVTLDQAPADLLARGEKTGQAVEAALRLGRLAIAAEAAAGAQEALRLMVDYAQSRRQFGRPIGGFQAVKHKCAEALIAIEAAKAAVSYATWALDDGSAEADLAILAAKMASTEAFVATAADCIQLHGTYGYTREAASQSYFRRARWLSLFLGSADEDGQRLADLLGV
jgi:alkylation response protein AidB-like acyl-CoA dehydrogenase